MTTPEPRKRPGDRHKPRPIPIPFRPPAAERAWLAAYAEQTGRAVNALLTEGVRLLRAQTENLRLREDHKTMDDSSKMAAEADVLRQAHAIIKQYRGGLETTLAVIEETEQALRAQARPGQ